MTSPIDTSMIPAQVRAQGPKAEALYGSALQFEQMLVQQLAQEMLKTAGDTGNEYASLLPNALADAVEQNGGLGLDLNLGGVGK
jgi:Rod binding domain-containing protein